MMTSMFRKTFVAFFGGIFAMAMIVVSYDPAEARGRGGHARMHGHHGHHTRPHHKFRPNKPHHRPNHRPGHGNHHHHHGHDRWHDSHHHHNHHHYYGRWAAGVATGLAIGSVAYSLPGSCRVIYANSLKYWDCGGVWYRARYQGSDVVYVVVDRP